MESNKLVHLKPTLWRAYVRASRKYGLLVGRFIASGHNAAIGRRMNYARDQVMELAGRCQAIECAIKNASEPLTGDPDALENFDPGRRVA